MKIGIDLDNTITADTNSREFFRVICHLLYPEYEIHIITNRDENSREDTVKALEELGVSVVMVTFESVQAARAYETESDANWP